MSKSGSWWSLVLVAVLCGQCSFMQGQMWSSATTGLARNGEKSQSSKQSGCVNKYDEVDPNGDCTTSACTTSCTSGSAFVRTRRLDALAPIPSPSHDAWNAGVDLDRIFQLVRLTRATAETEPEQSEALSEELFSLAFHMPVGWNRIAEEKNALVPLSKTNPHRAMELFLKVEAPQPFPGTSYFPEDVRADAATYIFPNYWRFAGRQGLAQIRRLATHIGDTGEYPYAAMGLVLEEFANSEGNGKVSSIYNIFAEALDHYQRHSNFQNRNEEFLKFLVSTKHVISRTLYERALRVFVDHLVSKDPRNEYFVAEILTSEGTILFRNQNHFLLFQVFPLIFKTNHTWAADLVRQHPSLRNARSKILYEAAGAVVGQPSGSQLESLRSQVLRLALLRTLERSRSTNPKAALKLANRLSNDSQAIARLRSETWEATAR